MTEDRKLQRSRNLVLVGLLAVVILSAAYHEGYLSLISLSFWGVLAGGLAMSVWLAFTVSTKRLLSLVLAVFIIEYVKESIGIRSKLWTYHGHNGFFNFGVWSWVLGGLSAYALATKVVTRGIRRLRFILPRWTNLLFLLAIALLIPSTLGDYRDGVGIMFISFYLLLLAADMFFSMKMEFPVFAGIVIAAWVIGNPSEYIGAMDSGVWTYTHDAVYPPVFLVFGCWPLEILAQCSLSSFLAGEPLDRSTASE